MRYRLAGLLLALALSGTADAAEKASLEQPVNYPGGVTVYRDVTYAVIEGFRPLTLDLFEMAPKPKAAPRPAILFVHGGGWISGDARHLKGFDDFPVILAALAAKGYVVASVNYRLAGEAHYPAAIQDVKSALRWLRSHATDHDIDTTRMMVWGVESGGQIAAMVGTSCGVAALEPVEDAQSKAQLASDCVQGVIDWAGPVDFASWDADAGRKAEEAAVTHLGAFLGCEPADCAPGLVHGASPMSYIGSQTPPFLIQQGAEDKLVAPAQSHKLYDALRAQRVPVDIAIYPEVGQDFARDGTPDPATSAKAIADMEDFIAKTFPPPPTDPSQNSGAKSKSIRARARK